MMLAIKVGQNEPDSYDKSSIMSKHGDIVGVFPHALTTFGRKGDKQYLAVLVDVKAVPGKHVDYALSHLSEQWVVNMGLVRCNECTTEFRFDLGVCPECGAEDFKDIQQVVNKNLYMIDLETISIFSTQKRAALAQARSVKNSIKPSVYQYVADYESIHGKKPPRGEVGAYQEALLESFDISGIQEFSVAVPFKSIVRYIVNKRTGQTLESELP